VIKEEDFEDEFDQDEDINEQSIGNDVKSRHSKATIGSDNNVFIQEANNQNFESNGNSSGFYD
jgi:hypothetical protein